MKKEDKGQIIAQLAETIQAYPHFYLVDVTALDATATSELRRKCFKQEIKMVVVKNTLLQKALESLEGDFSPLYGSLKGTTALFFCQTANVPARLLKDYADKKAEHNLPPVKTERPVPCERQPSSPGTSAADPYRIQRHHAHHRDYRN